jgi:hypothetical protein
MRQQPFAHVQEGQALAQLATGIGGEARGRREVQGHRRGVKSKGFPFQNGERCSRR